MKAWAMRPDHPRQELFDGWARAMAVRGLKADTIRGRRTNWVSWMDQVGDRWAEVDYHEVEAWLVGRALGETAACRAVSDLASFYKWARREGLATSDPTDLVERPKVPRRLPRPADEPGIVRALELGRPEDRRAVALMFYGGLRCCEVSRIRRRDVDLVEGWLDLDGKGDKARRVPVFEPLEPFLAELVDDAGDEHLFTGLRGAPATPGRTSALVNAHLRRCGCRFTAHQIRHRYATHMLARTKNVRLVQVLLGHAHLSTTEIYTLVELDGFADIHDLW